MEVSCFSEYLLHMALLGLPSGSLGKEPACQCRRQETRVRSLGQEDPLEEGMATHSSILAWRIPMDRGAWQATVHGVTRVGQDLATKPPLPGRWA